MMNESTGAFSPGTSPTIADGEAALATEERSKVRRESFQTRPAWVQSLRKKSGLEVPEDQLSTAQRKIPFKTD